MTRYQVEMTDTFGGEANYCWVRRATIDAVSIDRTPNAARISKLIKRAKEELGIVGRHIVTMCDPDMIRIDMQGAALCIFIYPEET